MTKDLSLTKQLELANETIRKMQESINELMNKMDARTREVHYIKKQHDDYCAKASHYKAMWEETVNENNRLQGWITAHKEIANHRAQVERIPEPYPTMYINKPKSVTDLKDNFTQNITDSMKY